MSANPFAKGAPAWRRQGWVGTILLPIGQKFPPPAGFTGHDGIDPDDEQVARWAAEGGNLGIRLPDGVIGIDLDWYKPDGQVSWTTLVNKLSPLPPTWRSTARTKDPRSGIYLFRVLQGAKLKGQLAKGIESIQWWHRYLCTWPSIHPECGKYLLTSPDGKMGFGPPCVDQLPELPADWLAEFTEPERAPGVAKPRESTGAWDRAVSVHFSEAIVGLGSASRHDSTRDRVNALLRLESQGYPGASEAIEQLHGHFVVAIQDRATPVDAEAEWQRMLNGGRKVIGSTPPAIPPYGDSLERRNGHGTATTASQPQAPASSDVIRAKLGHVDLSAGIADGLTVEPPEMLRRLDGVCLMYRGKINSLFGASNSGKTWLALLAIVQAMQDGKHAIYVDFEDDWRTFASRLLALGADASQIGAYVDYFAPVEPVDRDMRDWLVQLVQERHTELVVIDSTGEAIAARGGNQNDDKDVANWMDLLPRPLARAGAGVVLIDHIPKAQDAARQEIGSQRKRAAISGVSLEVNQTKPFSRDQGGEIQIVCGKDRGGNFAKGSTVGWADVTPRPGRLDIVLRAPARQPDTDGAWDMTLLRRLLDVVTNYAEANSGAPMSTNKIEQDVKGWGNDKKRTHLARLVEIGCLERVLAGKSTLYKPTGITLDGISDG